MIAVSGHEVRLALREDVPPTRIILNGNGKHEWELELAVSCGCLVNIDSTFDLSRLKIITERLDSSDWLKLDAVCGGVEGGGSTRSWISKNRCGILYKTEV